MSLNPKNKFSVKTAYDLTFKSVKTNPNLYLPFIIFGIVELTALIFIFLIPRMPFVLLFGPIIRTFWRDMFLHYPYNFYLLPKLASHSRTVLSVILGSLLTGAATAMVYKVYSGKPVNLGEALKAALKKYILIFIVIFVVAVLFHFSAKFIAGGIANLFLEHRKLMFLKPGLWLAPFLVCLNFLLVVIFNSLFIYAIPAIIVDQKKLFPALGASFLLFKRFFFPTLCLVGVPMLIYIPLVVLNYNPEFLVRKLFPESVLLVQIAGVVLNSLIVDPIVTISTTFFYLTRKEQA
ncbi:MAG: hypothetical protein PHN57_01020 [Candidatus Omnitrophica bacterium]|nr:hypothetical protein [Candidatus Omnitrophota bacterium]